MFDNDNAHVLTIGSHGVFVAPPQKETAFAHSRANKAVMYGITQREGVMLATDKSRAGFLAAPIRIADGLQRETLTTIAQMDTPSIALITHPHRRSVDPIDIVRTQCAGREMLPFISEYVMLSSASADVGILNWKGGLIVNVRATGDIGD